MWSSREAVEIFHILFLAELGTKLDKKLYAIKGGCNLRFFFKSPRYSEDLDLDAWKIARTTLTQKVEKIFDSRSLMLNLTASQIRIANYLSPKQTDTTQRWKLQLDLGGAGIHTKIEFSRRNAATATEFGPLDSVLVTGYRLSAVLASHYGPGAAIEQKVAALIGRSETQARDVFDLNLLLSRGEKLPGALLPRTQGEAAAERALSVSFDQFKAQVIGYLPEEQQPLYGEPTVWEQMVTNVVAYLMGGSS